jgi:hypothetical protein
VLVRRIRERAKAHRVKDRSDVEIREFLRGYRRDFTRVIGELEALGVRVVRVDTSRDPALAVAEHVRAAIEGGVRAR